jgi:hypothetical protein
LIREPVFMGDVREREQLLSAPFTVAMASARDCRVERHKLSATMAHACPPPDGGQFRDCGPSEVNRCAIVVRTAMEQSKPDPFFEQLAADLKEGVDAADRVDVVDAEVVWRELGLNVGPAEPDR